MITPEEAISMYRNLSKICVDKIIYQYRQMSVDKDKRYYDEDGIQKLMKSLVSEFKSFDFKTCTKEQLIEMGFSFWDDDLLLAPTWVILAAKEGTEFTTISGETKIKEKDNMSYDTRFGASAYGFTIKELRDNKIKSVLE